MAVASHLKIALHEYDARISTLIPYYDEALDAAAWALRAARRPLRLVVDLGTGSGALALRVARATPGTALVGIDEDEGMLGMARRRLKRHGAELVSGNFIRTALPRCDAITASFALHHVEHRRTKLDLYRRAHAALRPGGVLVSADCQPSTDASLAADGRRAWLAHLAKRYGTRKAQEFLDAWAEEDFYVPLDVELDLLSRAGFRPHVTWRRDSFAVIVAVRGR